MGGLPPKEIILTPIQAWWYRWNYQTSALIINMEHSPPCIFSKPWNKKHGTHGGGKLVAPAQRMVDFVQGKISSSLPRAALTSRHSMRLHCKEVLPGFISSFALEQAFQEFGKKMPGKHGNKGYFTNEAVVVATETRTSQPSADPKRCETSATPTDTRPLSLCGRRRICRRHRQRRHGRRARGHSHPCRTTAFIKGLLQPLVIILTFMLLNKWLLYPLRDEDPFFKLLPKALTP